MTSFGRFMVPFVKLASAIIPIELIKAIFLDLRIASIIIMIIVFIVKPISSIKQ